MPARLLLVEDEEHLMEVVKLNLELEGYEVRTAVNGRQALDRFHSERFDLILLDVMMPYMDGFSVCRAIRLENRRIPILFITAKNSAQDRVMGLKIGGDDYLVKPFDLEELLLRVRRLIERSANTTKVGFSEIEFGPCAIYFDRHSIRTRGGEILPISKREMMLLQLLTSRDGETVSRDEILDLIWGVDAFTTARAIDNFIVTFRKHFEKDPKNPVYFQSIRGVGYRFTSKPVDQT